MKPMAALLAASFIAAGCQPTIDPSTYGVGPIGIQDRHVDGRIISATPTTIDFSNHEGTQGGIAGGLIGGMANSGSRGGGVIAAVLIGAAVGAAIGSSLEARLRTSGYRYEVETTSGAHLVFIQPGGSMVEPGTAVTIFYGPPPRLQPARNNK